MSRQLTKEMKAKRRKSFRLVSSVIISIIMFFLVLYAAFNLFFPGAWESNKRFSAAQNMACFMSGGITFLIITTGYALLTGMNIGISNNYVVDYHLLSRYQLSRLHEDQDTWGRTTRLYLVMGLWEMGELERERRWSLWLDGHATLPVKVAIPGKDFSGLYICRSTLRRMLKNLTEADYERGYVELQFEFHKKCRTRTAFEKDCVLISAWDIPELRRLSSSKNEIQLDSDHSQQRLTRAQIDQYASTILDAYQIVDLPPAVPSSDE